MESTDVSTFLATVLASIGGGAVLVIAISSYIGKVWATTFLEKERHKLGAELEKTKKELDIVKETTLKFKNDKLQTYRDVVDVVSELLASLDAWEAGRICADEAARRYDDFNEKRIKVYGYLAMLAPQEVIDAQDRLMDYLLRVAAAKEKYEWKTVRQLSIAFLNEIRIDVGIDKRPIEYNGTLSL